MVAPRLEQGKGHSGSLRHETVARGADNHARDPRRQMARQERAGAAFGGDVGRANWPSPRPWPELNNSCAVAAVAPSR